MASISQSVDRAFDIFSLFADRQKELTAKEIVEYLEAPRSSTAALLNKLNELSLLSLNRRTQTYLPTVKFAELGTWLESSNRFPEALLDIMQKLQYDSGETVTVACRVNLEMEILRVARNSKPISFIAEPGQRIPLWGSALGTAYLATVNNNQIATLHEKSRRETDYIVDQAGAMVQIERARIEGYAVAHGAVFEDASAMAVMTPFEMAGRRLVVSVAGPKSRMVNKEERIGEMLLASILVSI